MEEKGRNLSVRKVVPTLTSKSAEIYLSMVGAKQHSDTGFILVPAVGRTSSRGTMVLVKGSYKRGGRGGGASRSLKVD
jgi:hypothetical protein